MNVKMFYQLRQTCLKKRKILQLKHIICYDKDQTVTVVNRQTNEKFKASYDKLILSPAGANSLGFDSDYIFTTIWRILMPSINIDQHQAKSISSRSRLYFIRSLGEFIC